jgi:hypothetical protein
MMRAFAALLFFVLAAAPAKAASPEDAYLAARDHAIATIAKLPEAKQDAEDTRALKGLEAQLKQIIAPPRLARFPGAPKMSPETLSKDGVESGGLDAFRLSGKDPDDVVLVTTDGLLQKWLSGHKTWWTDQPNAPTEPAAAFRSEAFYTQALSDDAAMSIYAPLPIAKPDSATIAVALLVEESQDIATEPPSKIAVAVAKGGKVFVSLVSVATKLAPIAACEAITKDYTARSDAALAKYHDSGLKDEKSFDESQKLTEDGAAALHKCWSEKASGAPEFPALTKQAQALADLFASQ